MTEYDDIESMDNDKAVRLSHVLLRNRRALVTSKLAQANESNRERMHGRADALSDASLLCTPEATFRAVCADVEIGLDHATHERLKAIENRADEREISRKAGAVSGWQSAMICVGVLRARYKIESA